jgi:DUF1365 family protein
VNEDRIPTTLTANGPVGEDAASLYVGSVMHARLKPVGHRFAYRVASLLVDLDRLAEADRSSRLFSVGRFNLFSFEESDHGPRDGSPLRAHVDRLLAEHGLDRPARVLLLCYPRVLGFVFNPLSVYFALDPDGRTVALVYEVRNTFGGIHTYVAPVRPGEETPAGLRQSRTKVFHVSPFLPMDQRYDFRILPPGEAVRIRILETDRDGPTLSATFAGRRTAMTDGALARIFAAMPFHTLKVIAAIHYEAARLWLKGAPFFGATPPADRAEPRNVRDVAARRS